MYLLREISCVLISAIWLTPYLVKWNRLDSRQLVLSHNIVILVALKRPCVLFLDKMK